MIFRKIILLVIFGYLSLAAHNASAARVEDMKDVPQWNDFDLGPASFPLELSPGESITKTIQVTNRLGREAEFSVDIEDFEGSSDLHQPVSLQGKNSGKYSAKDWIKTELDTFSLKHGQREFFDVTITVPESADPGDHYASVLVKTTSNKDTAETGANVQLTSRVGTLFFVKVPGDVVQKGKLQSFSATEPVVKEKKPIEFQTVFENTGTVRLTPFGSITITNMLGKQVSSIEIQPFNVLRESTRLHTEQWDPGLGFGRYRAVIHLNNSYNNKESVEEIYFWILPVKEMSIAGVACILVLILFFWIRRYVHFQVSLKK